MASLDNSAQAQCLGLPRKHDDIAKLERKEFENLRDKLIALLGQTLQQPQTVEAADLNPVETADNLEHMAPSVAPSGSIAESTGFKPSE